MSAVRIERVREEDWAALRDVRLRALLDSPDAFGSTHEREAGYSDDDWREWARDGSAGVRETCLLARVDGEAAGMVAAYVQDGAEHAHLIGMWVDPAARRRGVGGLLLEAIVGWATGAGLRSVRLDVALGNPDAARLYEGRGFSPTGRSRRYEDRPLLVTRELELRLEDEG